jgi:protocatechuate 3,4-dioxygenase beta subunit
MIHEVEATFRSTEHEGEGDVTDLENPRVKEIANRVLSDLLTTVTDLKVTELEIHQAAEFFNALGRAGEFPDLLDIFLAVTSVVATQGVEGGTTPNLAGPYYKAGAPSRPEGLLYDGEVPAGGIPVTVRGTVTHVETGLPLQGAELDLWQADSNGDYDVNGFQLRGIVRTNDAGEYTYRTVVPEGYEIPAKGPTSELLRLMGQTTWRPAHIHLRVNVDGAPVFQTQFFIEGARFLDSDPVGAVREDLITPVVDDPDGTGKQIRFDIRINPDRPAGVTYDKSAHK